MNYTMTIQSKVPSKSNSYRIITIGGHASLGKTKALKEYEKAFYLQCPCRGANIENYFSLELKVFHENNRPDLDNAMKILLDCLQTCKVIKNDRQCTEIHAYKYVDKTNPRVEIAIKEIEL
jgi:Holliday junction resolvase RusA-like endonuclease